MYDPYLTKSLRDIRLKFELHWSNRLLLQPKRKILNHITKTFSKFSLSFTLDYCNLAFVQLVMILIGPIYSQQKKIYLDKKR